MVTVPVIMAGGIGERFWPMSRSSSPKQLLRLTSRKTMIEETLGRISPLCASGVRPLIITGRSNARRMKRLIGDSCAYDCIVEPVGKNTAPAILLAAAWIEKTYGPSTMVVLSADHEIKPKTAFLAAVRSAVAFARANEALVVFGVKPTRPECGYGYIRVGRVVRSGGNTSIRKVSSFVEKPLPEVAEKFYRCKSYLWNCGMFVWKTETILNEFEKHLPDHLSNISGLRNRGFSAANIERFYRECSSISIDYGILEHSRNVYTVEGGFVWDDIGSWEAIARIKGCDKSGNTRVGRRVFTFDCSDSLTYNTTDSVVAAIGLDNTAVVVTPDAILVVHRSKLPDLKRYLAELKADKTLPKELF